MTIMKNNIKICGELKIMNNRNYLLPLIIILYLFFFTSLLFSETQDYKPEKIVYNVSVVGVVENPGVYPVVPTERVSGLLKIANTLLDTIPSDIVEIASQRNIILRRDDKEVALDLQRFYTFGNEKDNPYLFDGDVIFVPSIENKVTIYGAVNRSGIYELVNGDRIIDIIELAMGFRTDAYLNKAEIVRFVDEHDSTKIIEVNLEKIIADPECTDNLFLENDDRIFIKSIPEFHIKRGITISGEVEFPGGYSIDEGKTTLLEILQKCAGPTDKADLKNAFLQRRSKEDIVDLEFERLKKMLVEDMTDIEYEYFKTKSRELKGKYAINFEKLWRENDTSIFLKHGDFIYIPNKTITVSVLGQVKNPGLITFVPNQNYIYYIEKADGFAWRARKGKIRVIKSSTGEWLKPNKKTIIEVGDMIFIPEKKDYDYWKITKDVMRIAAEIATVVIVIQNVK